jgi:glycosyltransferase involved in cell wall biosynthesis
MPVTKVSIVTVVYNDKIGLEKTILSVKNQQYNQYELIIVDGGSTDGTVDVIKKYEKNISVWVSEKDGGIYDAMNKGIDISKGEWICFLNAGDIFFDDNVLMLFSQYSFMQYNYIYGRHVGVNGDKKVFYKVPRLVMENIKLPNHQAMFIKAFVMRRYKYDIKFKLIADMDLKIKLNELGKGLFIDSYFVCFDMTGLSCNYSDKKIEKLKIIEFFMMYKDKKINFMSFLELYCKYYRKRIMSFFCKSNKMIDVMRLF